MFCTKTRTIYVACITFYRATVENIKGKIKANFQRKEEQRRTRVNRDMLKLLSIWLDAVKEGKCSVNQGAH